MPPAPASASAARILLGGLDWREDDDLVQRCCRVRLEWPDVLQARAPAASDSETPPAGESALVWAVNSPQPAASNRCTTRPLGSVAATPCTPLRNNGWWQTSSCASVRDRLVGDGSHRVDGQQDPAYVGVGVAAHESDRVPAVGVVRREPLVEQPGDLSQCRHGSRLDRRARDRLVRRRSASAGQHRRPPARRHTVAQDPRVVEGQRVLAEEVGDGSPVRIVGVGPALGLRAFSRARRGTRRSPSGCVGRGRVRRTPPADAARRDPASTPVSSCSSLRPPAQGPRRPRGSRRAGPTGPRTAGFPRRTTSTLQHAVGLGERDHVDHHVDARVVCPIS